MKKPASGAGAGLVRWADSLAAVLIVIAGCRRSSARHLELRPAPFCYNGPNFLNLGVNPPQVAGEAQTCGGSLMAGDYFWQCVEALAAVFDGEPDAVEANLDAYEMHAKRLTIEERGAVRTQMNRIVGGLSRLSMRLAEVDGH
jgi:hypothetical protein